IDRSSLNPDRGQEPIYYRKQEQWVTARKQTTVKMLPLAEQNSTTLPTDLDSVSYSVEKVVEAALQRQLPSIVQRATVEKNSADFSSLLDLNAVDGNRETCVKSRILTDEEILAIAATQKPNVTEEFFDPNNTNLTNDTDEFDNSTKWFETTDWSFIYSVLEIQLPRPTRLRRIMVHGPQQGQIGSSSSSSGGPSAGGSSFGA
ncbi:unnamed protein product, partial [Amoebophrya sp. A120]